MYLVSVIPISIKNITNNNNDLKFLQTTKIYLIRCQLDILYVKIVAVSKILSAFWLFDMIFVEIGINDTIYIYTRVTYMNAQFIKGSLNEKSLIRRWPRHTLYTITKFTNALYFKVSRP